MNPDKKTLSQRLDAFIAKLTPEQIKLVLDYTIAYCSTCKTKLLLTSSGYYCEKCSNITSDFYFEEKNKNEKS